MSPRSSNVPRSGLRSKMVACHAEQDRDREEQPFRLHIPRVRLFPLGRVRLLILLLVRLHAPSYTKRATRRSRSSRPARQPRGRHAAMLTNW
jgi:hypothetical protein